MTKAVIDLLPTNLLITGDQETREVYINGKYLNPAPSQKVRNHSPDGFNWGYGGSGPAQLALAICLRYLSPSDAQTVYQSFKFNVISQIPQQKDFEITVDFRKEILKIVGEPE